MLTICWRACAVVAVCGTIACRAVPTECSGATTVGGSWSYAGDVTTPVRGSTTGTLTISDGGCGTFRGSADLTETTTTGTTLRSSGVISGRTVDATTVRFDLTLDANTPRQHIATVVGDSMRGSWVVTDAGSPSAAGTFTAVRRARP